MAWRTLGHRGDALEDLINITNDYYRANGYACINKIATPIKVVKQNEKGQIILGFFEKKSTVDFIGIAQNIAICFDTKETKSASLSLGNIHNHQIEYMQDFRSHGGISFLIVHFTSFEKYYLVPLEFIEKHIEIKNKGGKKSIKHSEFAHTYPIGFLNHQILHYLPAINAYLDDLEINNS